MRKEIKYIIDNTGNKTSVIVPLNEWKKLNNNYEKLRNKMNVLKGIKEGIAEIKEANRTGKKLQSLSDFLDEC